MDVRTKENLQLNTLEIVGIIWLSIMLWFSAGVTLVFMFGSPYKLCSTPALNIEYILPARTIGCWLAEEKK